MVLHILYGVFITGCIFPILSPQRRELAISRWSSTLLSILNIQVEVLGSRPPRHLKNTMFVANHISWLDIYVLNSVSAARFVAKSEIRQWPVLGWLAARANSLFVDRAKRHDAARIIDTVRQALQSGDRICFFPEGTTTDGKTVKPFKGSLLQAAIEAKSQVWPLSIAYSDAENRTNTEMAYWGEMSLIESMLLITRQQTPIVKLYFEDPMNAAAHNRKSLTLLSRQKIVDRLSLPG